MSYQDSVPVVATAAIKQFKAVGIGGTVVATPALALGIAQADAAIGEDVGLVYQGRSRALAGDAITKGDRVTLAASGYIVECGSNELGIGTALQTVTSGSVFEGIFNFAGAKTEVISGHLA